MTHVPEERREKSRKRWVPLVTAAILGSHIVMFFLLAQCGVKGPGYRSQVSYIRVQEKSHHQVSFEFEKPPERMFYQFATMPLGNNEEEPVPLAGPRWQGYEALVALRAEDYSPMENYRLTMELAKEARDKNLRRLRPQFYQPVFRTVVVRGTPLQPVTPVPEPGAIALCGVGLLGLVLRRRR